MVSRRRPCSGPLLGRADAEEGHPSSRLGYSSRSSCSSLVSRASPLARLVAAEIRADEVSRAQRTANISTLQTRKVAMSQSLTHRKRELYTASSTTKRMRKPLHSLLQAPPTCETDAVHLPLPASLPPPPSLDNAHAHKRDRQEYSILHFLNVIIYVNELHYNILAYIH